MINELEAKSQVQRLKALRAFPKLAEGEMTRTIRNHARNVTHAYEVITRIIDEEVMCPVPATLKGFLLEGKNTDDHAWKSHRTCPYGLCVGDGWRVHYILHTRHRDHLEKEEITAEQAAGLKGKLGQKQQVYEAVTKCQCAGGGAVNMSKANSEWHIEGGKDGV